MRPILLTATLLTFFGLAACADHGGSMIALDAPAPPTAPPISPPDDQTVIEPTDPADPGKGSNTGGGAGGGAPNGGDGGSPVPEPGTMLLVGTGLAGAALLRRRRKVQIEQQ
jgi:hypothetical protein